MKRMTPACILVWFSLRRKYKYFSRRNMLNADGSFYYDNKRLSKELGMNMKTIMRTKRYLKEAGYINIKPGEFKGSATQYWLLPKTDKKSPFQEHAKDDKISSKTDKKFSKGCQNVTPNKEITKKINYCINNQSEEELKNGLYELVKLKGVEYAKTFYMNREYNEDLINKLLEEYNETTNAC